MSLSGMARGRGCGDRQRLGPCSPRQGRPGTLGAGSSQKQNLTLLRPADTGIQCLAPRTGGSTFPLSAAGFAIVHGRGGGQQHRQGLADGTGQLGGSRDCSLGSTSPSSHLTDNSTQACASPKSIFIPQVILGPTCSDSWWSCTDTWSVRWSTSEVNRSLMASLSTGPPRPQQDPHCGMRVPHLPHACGSGGSVISFPFTKKKKTPPEQAGLRTVCLPFAGQASYTKRATGTFKVSGIFWHGERVTPDTAWVFDIVKLKSFPLLWIIP